MRRLVTENAAPTPDQLDSINRLTVVARLLSSAVHDTRNALQVVTGHAELFAEGPFDPDKARERSRVILSQSERATHRMQALVAMAIESVAGPEPVELRALADEVVGLRRSSFGRARIRAKVTPAIGEFWVVARRADLVRIAANLMLNAERAVTGRPGAEMVFDVSAGAGWVTLSVRDNGPGIDANVRAHLFEPFAATGGPGLGLFVSKRLAERAGGRLEIARSTDQGTEVTLTLPARTE